MRLEASLQSAGALPKIVFLHYPPKYKGYECPEIIELIILYHTIVIFSRRQKSRTPPSRLTADTLLIFTFIPASTTTALFLT